MKTVPVSAERHYQVEIGVQWRSALNDWVEGRNKVVAITSEKFAVKTDLPTIEVPDGESGKSAEVLTFIWEQLGKLGINRGDLIIGIGGGALTDLVGFAAATWMRGIDWLAIPTTVAGMVDAAVGGKTGGRQDSAAGIGALSGVFLFIMLVPSIAVGVRRLHDTGRSGWWWLINFVPIIGPLVILVFCVERGQPFVNRFGAGRRGRRNAPD